VVFYLVCQVYAKSKILCMKKPFVVFLSALCFYNVTEAQLKIGNNCTAINSNSLLELESTNMGFVMPRVSLTNVSSPSPLSSGLLTGTEVYSNTSPTGGSGNDVYLWTGSLWQPMGTVTSVAATAPVYVSNSSTTPSISLQGAAGGAAYGTGGGSAFTAAGTTGQILTSNGSSAPAWSDFGQSATTVNTTHTTTISSSASYAAVTDLSQTITVPANAVVVLSTQGGFIISGSISTTILGILNSSIQLAFFDGSTQIGQSQVVTTVGAINVSIILSLGANSPAFWSATQAFTLSPGSHTITVRAKLSAYNSSGNNCILGATTDNGLMGTLTSAIIKQ
jgi:hypothetical protein